MKIGILTFHSQLNYGGVLQCWALQTALENMGYEVLVIDREFEHQIRSVKAIFRGWTVKQWIKFLAKLLLRRPEALRIVRYYRTVRFVKRNLHLTSYSFKAWKDAPKDLGVDLIVVGSDQVWNGIWNNLGVYLLQGAPDVPAIGYAVSLGMIELPIERIADYKHAAKRFSSVTVREKEAGALLSKVGIDATHVADPVLLMDWSCWRTAKSIGLVCYFIGYEFSDGNVARILYDFHVKYSVQVHVYFQHYDNNWPILPGVRVHYCAGPSEFLKAMSNAQYILSDSFHALMFACVFGKNIRIIRPHQRGRQIMFARIEEFVGMYVVGPGVATSVQDALEGFASGVEIHFNKEAVGQFVQDSKGKLVKAIANAI